MNELKVASSLSRISWLVTVAGLGLRLAACFVIPIDPRTGQPYRTATRDVGDASPGYASATPLPAPQPPAPTLLNVRLYPLNAQANKGGMLSAQGVDNNAGHGSVSVAYLGDTLQGESTRVDASDAAFGLVYRQVLGLSPRSYSGRRGIANAHGARGVNAQCEYVLTGPGAGTGVCQFSDGADYQMHFGG